MAAPDAGLGLPALGRDGGGGRVPARPHLPAAAAVDELVLDGLLVVGLASIAVGGVLALAQDELKQVLAYSTISQYGYVVVAARARRRQGGRGRRGVLRARPRHGQERAVPDRRRGDRGDGGSTRLSRLGGLGAPSCRCWRPAAVAAAATLAALPLTIGLLQGRAVLRRRARARRARGRSSRRSRPALTFAYIGRFWVVIFLGPAARRSRRDLGVLLSRRSCVLAAVCVVGGIVVGPFADAGRGGRRP